MQSPLHNNCFTDMVCSYTRDERTTVLLLLLVVSNSSLTTKASLAYAYEHYITMLCYMMGTLTIL
jgi:hypothetical protein